MQRIAGIAREVRHTVEVSHGGSQTDHLALFEIEGTRLCFRGRAPVPIKEGDEVAAVWEPGDKGIHDVLAFHNRTLDVRDHNVHNSLEGIGCGSFFIAFMGIGGVLTAISGNWIGGMAMVAFAVLAVRLNRRVRTVKGETENKLQQVQALLEKHA